MKNFKKIKFRNILIFEMGSSKLINYSGPTWAEGAPVSTIVRVKGLLLEN